MSYDIIYLTSTGRLARRFRHQFRMACIKEEKQGWESLQAFDFNTWLHQIWLNSWPENLPAQELYRINLWKELAGQIPPPYPLEADLNLFVVLDENYKVMVRHKLDPTSGIPSKPLVEWRRLISSQFRKVLEEEGLFHPSHLPTYASVSIEKDLIPLPDSIYLSGFESPAPIECDFFELLEKRSNVKILKNPKVESKRLKAIALPTQQQEIMYLIQCLVEDAQSIPLHRIGVVAPDLNLYSGILKRSLQEVSGEKSSDGTSFFNITVDTFLSSSPLCKASLLPLKFILEREPRELLLSLLLSPYYGCWQGIRHSIARADRIWRDHSVEYGIEGLLSILRIKNSKIYEMIRPHITKGIMPFCRCDIAGKKKASYWTRQIQELWEILDFPNISSDERDTLAAKHLKEIIITIENQLSHITIDAYEFFSWIQLLAAQKPLQVGASEDAGIQIMGMLECRGLDFDKLYILGMNDRSLPQPVRPLPLLDTSERRLVQGGTSESQYDFAVKVFERLTDCAPDITLLRPEQDDAELLSPSPFWPDLDEKTASIDIWNEPGPVWFRVGWLKSAYEGLKLSRINSKESEAGVENTEKNPSLNPNILPCTLSTTQLETALTCPYKFFADTILKIEPLKQPQQAVTPLERGTKLHAVLASFTQMVRQKELNVEAAKEVALMLLTKCVHEVLKDIAADPHWQTEKVLWLGSNLLSKKASEVPGLLTAWLGEEIRHRQKGWMCIAEEIEFKNLNKNNWPFSLHGRIDRIDYQKSHGLICWDYKTGNLPKSADILKQLTAPQLPVYLLALLEGKISGMERYRDFHLNAQAGYIQLKSLKDTKIYLIKDISSSLTTWIETITKLGEILAKGDFPAIPYPVSNLEKKEKICEHCPFVTLCEKGLTSPLLAFDEEKSGD